MHVLLDVGNSRLEQVVREPIECSGGRKLLADGPGDLGWASEAHGSLHWIIHM